MPVLIVGRGGAVEIEALAYKGSTAKLPDSADGRLVVKADRKTRTVEHALKDGKFTLPIAGPTRVRLSFEQDKEVEIEFLVRPLAAEPPATITFRLLRRPEPYEHTYTKGTPGGS